MKKEKVKFVAGVNNLLNNSGNAIIEMENILVDEKSTKADALKLLQRFHADLYEQATALGLVFDESTATTRLCDKDC